MTNSFSVKRTLLALSICLCAVGNSALAAEVNLEKAEALMKQGKAADAYSLLEPFEFQQSGNVKFDYLLGIAALDSGKPDKATIAFERVLAVDPNFAGARIDMGRAYFQLGDFARAKVEFESVLAQNPPAAAKATIAKYLEAIEKRENASKTKSSAYIEATLGYDTNINFATGNSQIAVPALGNLIFTLNPSSVRISDSYRGLGFGGEVEHRITPDFGLYAGADMRARSNNTQDLFDSDSFDVRAGLAMGSGVNTFRFGGIAGRYVLDGKTNRDTNGLTGEWRHLVNPANLVSSFGQYARYRFEPTISVNNFEQSTYGVNWLHIYKDGKALVSATLLYGIERAPLRADGGKTFTGLRMGGQVQVNDKTEVFAGLGTQIGKFDAANAAFSPLGETLTRDDKQYDANLGLNWHFSKAWTLRPQVSYLRNKSNIVIYEHKRTDVSITIRRDFK
ncbi:MAG: tetratricopeptide repeat protein [Burkholderiales bacterium]|nr:tetratricopeptide repeat protein [Burkholderiales bacterium]